MSADNTISRCEIGMLMQRSLGDHEKDSALIVCLDQVLTDVVDAGCMSAVYECNNIATRAKTGS